MTLNPPDKWKQIREAVVEQDRRTCQDCGEQAIYLEVHHIIAKKAAGDDDFKNLITLCRKCHATRHRDEYGLSKTPKLQGLYSLLRLLQISYQDLAEAIGYSKTTVVRVISGERTASGKFRARTVCFLEEQLRNAPRLSESKLFED